MLTLRSPGLPRLLTKAYAAFADLVISGAGPFGAAETPVGSKIQDRKRYLEFDASNQDGVPQALRTLRDVLCEAIAINAAELDRSLLPPGRPHIQELLDRQCGPLLRLSLYPAGALGEVNQPHTDIDLFTLLPAATQPGLELMYDGKWLPAIPEQSHILVLPGELLQPFGGPPATLHRVVTGGVKRISASLFANANPTLNLHGGRRVGDALAERLRQVRRSDEDESVG